VERSLFVQSRLAPDSEASRGVYLRLVAGSCSDVAVEC
jgi:hypothetical protein